MLHLPIYEAVQSLASCCISSSVWDNRFKNVETHALYFPPTIASFMRKGDFESVEVRPLCEAEGGGLDLGSLTDCQIIVEAFETQGLYPPLLITCRVRHVKYGKRSQAYKIMWLKVMYN
jgi:hypothetical protein